MTFATDLVPQEDNIYSLGTDNLKWIIRGSLPLSDITGADDLKAIEAIGETTGLLKKTAANTWTLDTSNYVTSSGITSVTIGATSPVQSSTSTAQNGSSASTTISLKDAYGDTKNPYGSKTKNYVLAAPSNANGAPSFRTLVAADIPNLSWNKITSDKPTTLSGYGITNAVQYNGIDNDIGSSATAANAKAYWANNNKIPKGKVVFNYNSSGTEFTTLFSNNNNSYGSILRWGYQDAYIRILRAHPNQTTYNGWYTEDWEKISAGYADTAPWSGINNKPTTLSGYGITDAIKTVTSTDNAIVRFDGANGQVQKSGIIINDNDHLIAPSIRIANTYYGIAFGRTNGTPKETILHTGIKWVSSTHMPVIHITGYAYGLQSPVEFKIGFYIYGDKIGWSGATNMGSWEPDIYLFKDTRGETSYVAVGLAGSCYFLQLSVDLQDEMGKFNNVIPTDWTWDFLTTEGTIPSADDGTTCVKVSYRASIFGAKYANITSTTNAVAYYTDTAGKFGSKASANGVLYATSANGALQWGTLPIAQGGTGKTNAADAWTALGGGASGKHADSYFALASHTHAASDINSGTFDAARIPNLSWSKITSGKPTTLSGYGITDAKIASGVITLGSNTITPITNIADLTGSTITAANLRTNLGLSAALRFIGKATTDMSESTTTIPTVTGVTNYVPEVGDVVLDKNSDAEYVCIAKSDSTYTWELLGRSGSWATSTHTHGNITNGGLLGAASMAVVTDSSKKITTADLSVSDSNASTNATTTFVQAVTQSTQGKITVTKASLNTSGEWSGNAGTATAIKTAGTTAQFYRGDNSWSNILKQTAASALGIDTNCKIGTAIKDLHFTVGSGSGTGINNGNAGGITIGTDTASYGGIYWQSSGAYGLRLHFATTGSFANGAYTRMLITHDGKVGIGTLSPDTLLTVNGNAKADKFIGALQGNADTAGKWATARTLTIGNKGQSVDGSGNVSWSLADIGAAASSHTHNESDITWSNGTLYPIGDDIYIGDVNQAGHLGLKSHPAGNTGLAFIKQATANDTTISAPSGTSIGKITWDGTKFSITSDTAIAGTITNATNATYAVNATALYTTSVSNATEEGQDARIKAAIKSYFDNNTASVPRGKTISLSISTGNAVQATGYFISGYDSNPYGGFFITHYDTPRYVGISNGNYSCYELVRNNGDTYSINVTGTAGGVAWTNVSGRPTNLNQFTNGPGYTTNTGTVTSVKLIQGAGITVSSSGTAITTTGERTISITGMDTTNGSTTKWLNQQGEWTTPPNDNTHCVTKLIAGGSSATSNAAVSSGNVYLRLFDDSTHRNNIQLKPGNNMTITSDASGIITFAATDTTYSTVNKTEAGLCPQLPNETTTTKFLRQDGTWQVPAYIADTHYTTHLYVNATAGGATNNAATANTTTYMHLYDNTTKRETIQFKGSGATTITATGGVITINSTDNNTDTKVSQSVTTTANWRKVLLHHKDDTSSTAAETDQTDVVYGAQYISAQPSTGTLRANAYRVTDNVTLQWNANDSSLEFIFA